MRRAFTYPTAYRPKRAISTQHRPRIFYGWRIAAARVALPTLLNGIGSHGLGVSLPSPEEEFDAGPSSVSLGTTTSFLLLFSNATRHAARVARSVDRRRRRIVAGTALAVMCSSTPLTELPERRMLASWPRLA